MRRIHVPSYNALETGQLWWCLTLQGGSDVPFHAGTAMFSGYRNADAIPLVELRMEPLIREVGPARFWNADDPVLTHLFNAINQLDWHSAGYMIAALERICDTQPDLPEGLVAHIRAYLVHLRLGEQYNAEHLELLHQLGYSNSIPEKLRFENVLPQESMDNRELAALVNVYGWMVLCVSSFLLGKQWFLLATAIKPAAVFRWRTVVETIHRGLLTAVMQQLDVDAGTRNRMWNRIQWPGMRLFMYHFYRLLKADGCFSSGRRRATVSDLYRIFVAPGKGYLWTTLRFQQQYRKTAGDSATIDNAQTADDFVLNARHYLEQLNPEVDNETFFSGRYFQNL